MKKIVLLVIFILFPAISYAQPSIAFDAENYDFGTVSQGDLIEHTFELTNSGDKELVIEKLVPSWGCAAVVASSSHLNPGEKGRITAKIDIKGRVGVVSKTIQVFSNDPKRHVVSLSVRAIIKKQ
jgi:uncharacterized protein DUF1573